MKNGFTLMETIVYIALLSILIGGSILITYQIIQGTESMNAKTTIDEEAHFLLRKIDWALSGAESITTTGSILDIVTGALTLTIDANSNNMRIARNHGTPIILNSVNVVVSNLTFVRTVVSGKPDEIQVSFMLNGRQFEQTRYIRK